MSLPTYVADPAHGFSASERAALTQWHNEFVADDAWRLIQRNFDRECARRDIEHRVFREFLRDLAARYLPNQVSPTNVVDAVVHARRAHFLLPGCTLGPSGQRLSRVMRADHFLKHQLHAAGIALMMNLQGLVAAIQAQAFSGWDLAGSCIGRADFAVWVCKSDDLQIGASTDGLRDVLGLKHIEHGHLVEIRYPDLVLSNGHTALRAPTVLDALANGAENWIFAKRRSPGGPEWGQTVNLATSSPGVSEAVHGDFYVDATRAVQVELSYLGQITQSPAQVDFQALLTQV